MLTTASMRHPIQRFDEDQVLNSFIYFTKRY